MSMALKYGMMKRKKMAEGGEMKAPAPEAMHGEESEMHEMDMVDRIMHKRAKMMSEGGMIANGGEGEPEAHPDQMENEFDDLALRDHLESTYDGANSGDELGNEELANEEGDLVSRIMRSRSKKDRNPRPA